MTDTTRCNSVSKGGDGDKGLLMSEWNRDVDGGDRDFDDATMR